MTSPKMLMLNAYRGIFSERYPVSPEFWCYYPAKVLGVDMIEFEREIPLWKGLLAAFRKYGAEGYCVMGAAVYNPKIETTSVFKKIPGETDRYVDSISIRLGGLRLQKKVLYLKNDPSWVVAYPVRTEAEMDAFFHAVVSDDIAYDFTEVNRAYEGVGEDILAEFSLGASFVDFFIGAMGFENAVCYFKFLDEDKLYAYMRRYIEHKIKLLREAAEKTNFETVQTGSGISCVALVGASFWRKWDKPYQAAITEEAHRLNLLVHSHNHGKLMDTVPDFAEIGFDCVCPFEREPGDVIGLEGLKRVRRQLDGKVTFKGNVHTIATLINGKPEDVRREVREIKEAFAGSPRLIISTGDQVGGETPEENIYAMLEEGRR